MKRWLSKILSSDKHPSAHEVSKPSVPKSANLKQVDDWVNDAFKAMGVGIALTDLTGNIIYYNDQAQRLTSISEIAVKGKNLSQVFPSLAFNFDGDLNDRGVSVQELSFNKSGGAKKQLRLTVAPLSDPSKGHIGFVSIFEDITKQKEVEEKLHLEEEIRKARRQELSNQIRTLLEKGFQFEGAIGQSTEIYAIYRLIQQMAATNINVLITGEIGTGKELVARSIHLNGPRREKPFVVVRCASIEDSLIENEIFGNIRVSHLPGYLKSANGGTIFLDGVDGLPLHVQMKLLGVLQDKSFSLVGGSKQVAVDVRLISSSNKDLKMEISKGQFREELFYRLNVVQIAVPPLRNRKKDIPLLTQHFIDKFAQEHNKQVERISSSALMYLMSHSYPGNIRELENIIERAVAVTKGIVLTEDDLPPYIYEEVRISDKEIPISDEVRLLQKTAPEGGLFFNKGITLDDKLATHEKSLLIEALKMAGGVQKKAAELLGINYRSFRHRLEKYGLLGNHPHRG